jgi:hypothetical protein
MPDQNSSRLAAKANQLYWQTSRPAGHLADELGISRSKFYALIEPLRLDVKCQVCGAQLAFSSRSDREAGRGRCAECGALTQVADRETAEPAAAAVEQPAAAPSTAESAGAEVANQNQVLWATAIAGAALGIMFTAWWRRR